MRFNDVCVESLNQKFQCVLIPKCMPGMSQILKRFPGPKAWAFIKVVNRSRSCTHWGCFRLHLWNVQMKYGTPASTNDKSSFVTQDLTLFTYKNKTNISPIFTDWKFTNYSHHYIHFNNIPSLHKLEHPNGCEISQQRHLRLPYEVAFDPLLRPEGWELRRIAKELMSS